MINSQDKRIASYTHKVQYYETDQMQVVHHSNYLRFYEEARGHFMESIGMGYHTMEDQGLMIPVTGASLKYIGAALYPRELRIFSKIVKYTGVRMTVEYEIYDMETGDLINKGETKHAFVDSNFRPCAIQKSFPEFHQKFLDYTVSKDNK